MDDEVKIFFIAVIIAFILALMLMYKANKIIL